MTVRRAGVPFTSDTDKAAKNTGITALTGMGSDSETDNVLVKRYANRLDRVDEIYPYRMVSVAKPAGTAWDHSLHTVFGKISRYVDSGIIRAESRGGEETERFPEPLGKCLINYTGHSQPVTIPYCIEGTRAAVIKGAFMPRWGDAPIKKRKETRLPGNDPIDVKGAGVTPCGLVLKLRERIPEDRDNGPTARFYEDFCEFRYDDPGRIKDPIQKHGGRIAAIIMTSFSCPLHQKMEIPESGFLEKTGKLTNRHKAVPVFDKVRICFRLRIGGHGDYSCMPIPIVDIWRKIRIKRCQALVS